MTVDLLHILLFYFLYYSKKKVKSSHEQEGEGMLCAACLYSVVAAVLDAAAALIPCDDAAAAAWGSALYQGGRRHFRSSLVVGNAERLQTRPFRLDTGVAFPHHHRTVPRAACARASLLPLRGGGAEAGGDGNAGAGAGEEEEEEGEEEENEEDYERMRSKRLRKNQARHAYMRVRTPARVFVALRSRVKVQLLSAVLGFVCLRIVKTEDCYNESVDPSPR